jgi:hypothetical protein
MIIRKAIKKNIWSKFGHCPNWPRCRQLFEGDISASPGKVQLPYKQKEFFAGAIKSSLDFSAGAELFFGVILTAPA